jgi:hypothetical protein
MPARPSIGEHVATEGERIIDNATSTYYKYPPYIIDEATGTYDVDCSGFVSLVLGNVAPVHFGAIVDAEGDIWPRADELYEFLATSPTDDSTGWRRIDRLADSRPGDIIGWPLEPVEPGHDTGHVLIVAGAPQPIDEDHIAVPTYDSSDVLHYDDSRRLPDGQPTTGVGSGTIHFRVDPDGKPTEFQFGPGDGCHKVPIAIGRLVPIPTGSTS